MRAVYGKKSLAMLKDTFALLMFYAADAKMIAMRDKNHAALGFLPILQELAAIMTEIHV